MPDGQLTTHVLDTRSGKPARGIAYVLHFLPSGFGEAREVIASGVTDADGRADGPILQGKGLKPGEYCLEFDAQGYFRATAEGPVDPFLGVVALNFRVTDPNQRYHVPLILSPFGYSTYRGS